MAVNINRHAYVKFTGRPYIDNVGIPCHARQNYTYVPQPENRTRTIIRTNQPYHFNYNPHCIEGFALSKKNNAKSCDCDDDE